MNNQSRLNENFKKISQAIIDLRKEVADLKKEISGYRTLLIDLRGETAVDLHTSFNQEQKK